MGGRQKIFGCFLGLITIMGCEMGCEQIGQRPNGSSGMLDKKNQMLAEAPAPAPRSLSISGPVSTPPVAPPITQTSGVLETRPETSAPTAPPKVNLAAGSPPAATPLPSLDPNHPISPLRDLYQKAAQKQASMDSYTLRLRRREVVGNQNRPEEVLLFKWRKEPWSVYFKWLGTEGKGREVVYVKGRYENALHTLTAAGDIPLLPPGKHIKVSPDGIMVKSKSRYPITEAGLGGLIERFGKILEGMEKGDAREGTLKYLGQLKRPEYENKVEAVLQTIPPQSDANLMRGGQRMWFFDPTLHLPMLIITQDETGREVEYYCHDRFMFPVNLTDDDFNPDVLWKTASPKQ